jgi:soluble lytic murein transglycosylase-like protein
MIKRSLCILFTTIVLLFDSGGAEERGLDAFYFTQRLARTLSGNHPPQRATPTRNDIDRLIETVATRYRINPDFVRAVVRVESNYDVHARSSAGAMGLMQLMPDTARELGVQDPWDARSNLDGGTRYLAALLREFGDAEKALGAYHAGPTYLRQSRELPAVSQQYAREVTRRFRRLVRSK